MPSPTMRNEPCTHCGRPVRITWIEARGIRAGDLTRNPTRAELHDDQVDVGGGGLIDDLCTREPV
jgi:hypothetical protein